MNTKSPENQSPQDIASPKSSIKNARKFAWRIFLQAGDIGKDFFN
ncbi:hypothetical protein [Bdellovibrio sp. HCB288]